MIGEDVPIELTDTGGTAIFRSLAVDLSENAEKQQVEVSLNYPNGSKEIVDLNLKGWTNVVFFLPAAGGKDNTTRRQTVKPKFRKARTTRSSITNRDHTVTWFHSGEHVHFVLYHRGFMQSGLSLSEYGDTQHTPYLWIFDGFVNVFDGRRITTGGTTDKGQSSRIEDRSHKRRFPLRFDYRPPADFLLFLNGKTYDLAKGRVFVLGVQGEPEQLAIDSPPFDPKNIDSLVKSIEDAKAHPETTSRLPVRDYEWVEIEGLAVSHNGTKKLTSADPLQQATNKQEMQTFSARITGPGGEPVVGAVVIPWALRSSQGHGPWQIGGSGDSEPPTLKTDSKGFVEVTYPVYAKWEERVSTTQVTLSIDHPKYAYIMYEDVDVPYEDAKPYEATLQRGVALEVSPMIGGKSVPLEDIYAMWSGGRSWKKGYRPAVTATGALRIPPLAQGNAQLLLVRLQDEVATHFSSIVDFDLAEQDAEQGPEQETVTQLIELRPALEVRGRLSDDVPRPVKNGRVKVETIPTSEPDIGGEAVNWITWAPIAEDGTFAIRSWPADRPMQLIALCDGYIALSGERPSMVTPERARGAYYRPQVFLTPGDTDSVVVGMTPTVQCEIETVDDAGNPLKGIVVTSYPNVGWWNDGSQVYCSRLVRGERLLLTQDYYAAIDKDFSQPFHDVTDKRGHASLELPVDEDQIRAKSDDYELPIFLGRRDHPITLIAGQTTKVRLVMQPRGTEQLGEWDSLAGLVFGCTTERCQLLLKQQPQFRKKLEEFRKQLENAADPRDPALLRDAYNAIADAFKEFGDFEEVIRWRRKAAKEAERVKQRSSEQENEATAGSKKQSNAPATIVTEVVENAADADVRTMEIRITDEEGVPLVGARLHVGISYMRGYDGERVPKDYVTDSAGIVNVRLPRRVQILRLWPSKSGYVPEFVNFAEGTHDEGKRIPDRYEFELARGTELSGTVVDESGEPVSGVVVDVKVEVREPAWAVNPKPMISTWLTDEDYNKGSAVTDKDGKWKINNAPAQADRKDFEFRLKFTHKDYVSDSKWSEQQGQQKLMTEMLRNGSAKLALRRGTRLRGMVVDSNGTPVTQGSVIWRDDPYGDAKQFETKLDKAGRFETDALPPGEHTVTIIAPSYQPERQTVTVTRAMPDLQYKLQPGKRLTVKVVDVDGKPIPKARFQVVSWRSTRSEIIGGPSGVFEGRIPHRADDQGIYVWDGVPADGVTYRIMAKGFSSDKVTLVANGSEHIVKLFPMLVASGQVTDAKTGKPIKEFRVVPVKVFRPKFLSTDFQNEVVGRDGKYELTLGGMDEHDYRYHVRIDADGFRTAIGEGSFKLSDGRVTQDFALEPAAARTGKVVDREGQPVASAAVVEGTPSSVPGMRNAELDWGGRHVATSSDGQFQLAATFEPIRIRVTHESGFAEVLRQPDEAIGTIQLQPWARVSGQLLQDGKPVPDETIYFFPVLGGNLGEPRFQDSFHTRTDLDGRFEFERLPPIAGSLRAYLGPWRESALTSSQAVPLDLNPGEHKTLALGGNGSTVTGKVIATGRGGAPLNKNWSLNYLIRKDSGIEFPEGFPKLSFDPAGQVQTSWCLDPSYKNWLATRERYFVKLAPDGQLRISGVPPGRYDLVLRLYEQPAGCLVQTIGERVVTIEVTESDATLGTKDIGTIEVECRVGPRVDENMQLYKFTDTSGRERSIQEMNGRYVLMHVWASWCAPCLESMPDIQATIKRLSDQPITFVGLNIDQDASKAKSLARQRGWNWSQNYLGDDSDMARQLAISSVPTYFLIGPDGLLVASATDWSEMKEKFEAEELAGKIKPKNKSGKDNTVGKTNKRGPILRGRVTDESDNPISDVRVVLYSGIATRWRGQDTMTNAQGEYRFDPLKTGARMMPDDGPSQWYTGVKFNHATHVPADGNSWRDIRVPMVEGHEEILDLRMTRGGKVSGIVMDAESGEPSPELDLRIHHGLTGGDKNGSFLNYVTTDKRGRFLSDAIYPGQYVIDINDNDYQGKYKYPKIGKVVVQAGETTEVRLSTRERPDLQDP